MKQIKKALLEIKKQAINLKQTISRRADNKKIEAIRNKINSLK